MCKRNINVYFPKLMTGNEYFSGGCVDSATVTKCHSVLNYKWLRGNSHTVAKWDFLRWL